MSQDVVNVGKAHAMRETDKALRVQIEAEESPRWIPKSVISDDSEVFNARDNADGDLVLKRWFAEKEGLG